MNHGRILVTGASGMIGSATVDALLSRGYEVIGIDRRESHREAQAYQHFVMDLGDARGLKQLVSDCNVDRVIHLAALAHTAKGESFSPEEYHYFNVECAQNVFSAAGDKPVLFISTVDVYGFTKEVVDGNSPVHPVSSYAISKVHAEEICRTLPHYTILRFSPVYTPSIKRDIQKRYYLKYPKIAYRIGKGTEYEILDIRNAVAEILMWCEKEPENDIRVIKDSQRMHTADYIRKEKSQGRASIVIPVPRWIVKFGYNILKLFIGKRPVVYLLHKAVYPLRSSSIAGDHIQNRDVEHEEKNSRS